MFSNVLAAPVPIVPTTVLKKVLVPAVPTPHRRYGILVAGIPIYSTIYSTLYVTTKLNGIFHSFKQTPLLILFVVFVSLYYVLTVAFSSVGWFH